MLLIDHEAQVIVRSRAAVICLLAAAWLASFSSIAHAQAYPTRPVRIVVAFTAGGTTDILARSVGQQLSERLKQPFVIENKPGAGGNIGTEAVVRSTPDGYTLIVDSVGPIAVNPTLYKGLGYNPLTDLVPIVQIADVPNVLVVHPSLGVKNFAEFIAYAKANPGKLNYSSTGVGTSSHLSGYMLCKRVGIDATHIPYKGADALNDLLSGRMQFMVATIPSLIGHIQGGKLVPIAVAARNVRASCRTCQPSSRAAWPASKPALGWASSHPRARPTRSPRNSTRQ
jgi:tripartite-type tricarboxylate transporter receptor subunit TctC